MYARLQAEYPSIHAESAEDTRIGFTSEVLDDDITVAGSVVLTVNIEITEGGGDPAIFAYVFFAFFGH
jgi:hypothetical protein